MLIIGLLELKNNSKPIAIKILTLKIIAKTVIRKRIFTWKNKIIWKQETVIINGVGIKVK